jgi:Immunity protein 32
MNDQTFLLTFEWDDKNKVLEIHTDGEGLEKLRLMLTHLTESKKNDHIHLMTPNWGGNELSNEKQCELNELIDHVKIYKWEK